jgi:hypothetical protein
MAISLKNSGVRRLALDVASLADVCAELYQAIRMMPKNCKE